MNTSVDKQNSENPASLKWVFYILGGASLVVTLLIVFAFLVVWMPMKSYISDKPFDIEYHPTSKAQQQIIQQKLSSFFQGNSQDTLFLNSEDVNNLLSGNLLLKKYDVKYRIDLHDSLFNLRCVVPAANIKNHMASIIKFVKVEGFINAEMEGLVLLKGKKLTLVATRSQMNSRPAPFTLLGNRARIELNQFFPDPMQYKRVMDKIKSVFIKNGKLVIVREVKDRE